MMDVSTPIAAQVLSLLPLTQGLRGLINSRCPFGLLVVSEEECISLLLFLHPHLGKAEEGEIAAALFQDCFSALSFEEEDPLPPFPGHCCCILHPLWALDPPHRGDVAQGHDVTWQQ